jgi:hypothetical protein
MKAIRCIADNPGQSICLHEDGTVRLHAKGRTIAYVVSAGDSNAIELMVCTLNMLAAGKCGQPCKVYKPKPKKK